MITLDTTIAGLERAERALLDLAGGGDNKAQYYAEACRAGIERLREMEQLPAKWVALHGYDKHGVAEWIEAHGKQPPEGE